MDGVYRDQVIALAGIFQAAHLVRQLAYQGRTDGIALAASLHSVLERNSETAADIYGNARGVKLGLQILRDKLRGRNNSSDMETVRYVVSVLQLERRVKRNMAMVKAIRAGVESVTSQMQFFTGQRREAERIHPLLAAKLAHLYTHTLSALPPRIVVNGEQRYLSDPSIIDKVRATLFAGTRSAFLWRQRGGGRWHLLFKRNAIIREATQILETLH